MKLKKTMSGFMAATMLMAAGVSANAVDPNTQVFDDVSSTSWYCEAVHTAYYHKLVNGVSPSQYAPNATMTRAMTVQILYNYAEKPNAAWGMQFNDVPETAWYYNAIKWAVAQGITNGTSPTTFSPEDNVTREQFATFLYNYIGNSDASGALNYPDAADVSSWAAKSMLWATQNKVINGSVDNGVLMLRPQGYTSRAEAAQMFTNYLNVTDGHSYEKTGGEAASCTEDGHTDYECSICGKTKTETVSAIGSHSYTNEITEKPTCTETGVKTFTCSACGESYTEEIPATGHNYSAAVVTKKATCTEDGIRTGTCATCGENYTEAIPATGHNYTSAITTEATCDADGVRTYTCQNCGDTYTERIPATGKHSYTSEITKAATCTEAGVKTFTCSGCGKTYTESIPATGHNYVTTTTKPATCQEEGVETTACSKCGDVQSTEVLPKTDHNYIEEVVVEANCDHSGTSTFTCSGCGDSYTLTYIDGHDFRVQSYKVWGVVSEYVKCYQCNNCFAYLDDSSDFWDHWETEECKAKNIGNGYSTARMPIYTLADENTPGAQEITIKTGWKCSKCGRETKQFNY